MALSIAACSGFGGSEVDEPSVDLGLLDVGVYPTQPVDYGTASTDRMVLHRVREAQRLAEFFPLPADVDPSLTVLEDYSANVFLDGKTNSSPRIHSVVSLKPISGDALTSAGFVAGFATSGATSEYSGQLGLTLSYAGLVYRDAAAAAIGAAALADAGFNTGQGEPVQLVRFPASRSAWQPKEQTQAAWHVIGAVVVIVVAENPENRALGITELASLTGLVEGSLGVLSERLTPYRPTPVDQLAAMPLDTDGLLRRTVPEATGDEDAVQRGIYDARADLHLRRDPRRYAGLYEEYGIDRVAYRGATLVRARDADSARRYLAAIAVGKYLVREDAPAGLPQARCARNRSLRQADGTEKYTCSVTFDRFTATVHSAWLRDAQQRISAQYAILVNSR
ncbi:hypothetical protein NN3_40300 [Nocardia neocaledoniensis NBRC 108232]|uniref:Uncharacterized protein n=2 Tax=Nocardia neocaledoniensis TaxID=236511 RepID=A0A317NQP1_9NOCA|nr:hypothetical protein DFR69_103285 [Nocardia neocaledoniensis]GEM33023.1 hypothetical protein NN3_40300 [Nocardia neocaledoniensis NBRC 108232]